MTYAKIPRRLGLLPAFLFAAVLQTTPARAYPRVIHNFALDGTMNNGDYIGPAICAVACFAATYSFGTIPYYSLDQPRNVTLVYNGDQASPRPFLFADVDPNDGTGVMVNGYTMEATVNSSPVTFVNGSTQLSFGGGPYTQRLSGQFDASALATNVYPVVITIRATFADGQVVTKTINTQVMVVNEMSSPIAKGWTVAGVQHLYSTLGNGFMVTEGDGSAVRFTSLNIKAADYTSLSFDNGTQSYTRWYPDGTRVVFNSVGQETSLIEISGRTYTFWYDSSGRLQAVKDPYRKQLSGAVTSIGLSYDANGLQMVQEPGTDGTQWQGRGTWFVVNANRCLQSAQDPDGVSTVLRRERTACHHHRSSRWNNYSRVRQLMEAFFGDAASGPDRRRWRYNNSGQPRRSLLCLADRRRGLGRRSRGTHHAVCSQPIRPSREYHRPGRSPHAVEHERHSATQHHASRRICGFHGL